MDTLLKSVLDLVQQYQDSGVTITCNAVLGKETSLTLKWNTSQRPTHSQSRRAAPLRTSTKGKAKHKSPSQRRRDFRRLQAWKASRKRQDVTPDQYTGTGTISQPESSKNVKISQNVNSRNAERCENVTCYNSSSLIEGNIHSGCVKIGNHDSKHDNPAMSGQHSTCQSVHSINSILNDNNDQSSNSIELHQSDMSTETKDNHSIHSIQCLQTDTQNGLSNPASIPIEFVEYFEAHMRALPSGIDSGNGRNNIFHNFNRLIVAHDQSWSQHINVMPKNYCNIACNQYPAELYFKDYLRLFKMDWKWFT